MPASPIAKQKSETRREEEPLSKIRPQGIAFTRLRNRRSAVELGPIYPVRVAGVASATADSNNY